MSGASATLCWTHSETAPDLDIQTMDFIYKWTNLVSPECVTPPRLLNTAVRGGVTNFATFTCLHHANNPNVK